MGLTQAVVGICELSTGILLARLLTAAEFGIFGVITFTLSFMTKLGDVGLGASLIRQADEPEEADYRVIFTVQQLLTSIVVAVVWLIAPYLADGYHLAPHDAWLFRAVALAFLVTSFYTIPALRLERHLHFDRLSVAEVSMAVTFTSLAVGLAYAGYGATSFAVAMLGRSIAGAIAIQFVSPWRYRWQWSWPRLRGHLRFGIPYQGISVVSLIKDSITPVLVGLLIGTAQVGFINWAQMVSAYALMALMAFQRIYLPMFARLQDDRALLGATVERVLWATNGVTAPLAVLTFVLFEPLTIQVFGPQWLEARNLFVLTWFANFFVPSVTPLMGLMSALGHSRVPLAFALIWMAGTWLVGVPMILLYGSLGYGIANIAVQLTNIGLFVIAKREVPFVILRTVAAEWIVAGAVGVGVWAVQHAVPITNQLHLGLYIVVALTSYIALMTLVDREAVRKMRAFVRGEATASPAT